MKKHVLAALAGTAVGAVVATYAAGPLLAQDAANKASVYQQLDLFGDVFERIRKEYVEEVPPEKLIEAAINGMLTSLDPHSAYLAKKEKEDLEIQTRGEFGGLGIEVTQEEGFVKVITPIDDTPAAAAGLMPGDFITHVDGESLLGLTMDQQVGKMRGPIGSETVITIVREGTAEPFDVSLIRDRIKLTVVRTRLEGDTAVVRLTTFNAQSYSALEAGIKKLFEDAGGADKVNGVVLDLRNNAGGLLNQAIMVSDAFLEQGEIVSTRGRTAVDGERFNATAGDLTGGKPMVVLINGGTASASEIVAAALQDHDRAIVVGTKSFGKGTVQSNIPLRGDGSIKLTTSRYYTPSGRSIQALGVHPDILVVQPPRTPEGEAKPEAPKSAVRSRSEAELRGSLSNDSMTADERKLLEEEAAKAEASAKLRVEDYQLAYAIDILRGASAVGREKK